MQQARQRWRWIVTAASIVVPLVLVLASLSYRGGIWLMVALAAGAAASVVLVELGERHHHHPRRASERPDLPGSEQTVRVIDVYGKRVD
jgi:anti-sigma-K factor RskA